MPKCQCKNFYYIVAEGAWILRCRCKHKHVEHDCSKQGFPCKKQSCQCKLFDSPFVCNCNHGWASHKQRYYVTSLIKHLLPETTVGDVNHVQRGMEQLQLQ